MLQIVNGELKFPLHKVVYKQHGKDYEDYTNDKEWWEDFAEKWKHTEIIEFATPEFTQEQHRRLEEVKHLGEAYAHFAEEYVLNGLFPNQVENVEERVINHPLKELQLQKEGEQLGQYVTQVEIDSMMQGQNQSEVELRLLLLEMGGGMNG